MTSIGLMCFLCYTVAATAAAIAAAAATFFFLSKSTCVQNVSSFWIFSVNASIFFTLLRFFFQM